MLKLSKIFLFFSLLFSLSFISQANQTYQITETQLTNLEIILNQLEQNNNDLLIKLNNSNLTMKELLREKENQLKERQIILIELEDYKNKFNLTEQQLIQIQNSLNQQEQLLKTLEKQVSQIKRQRNIAVLTAIFEGIIIIILL